MSCTKPGMFALTFDDGVTKSTPYILEVLEREQVKATFFVVGETLIERGRLPILAKIHEQGHSIGNHTWTHLNLNWLPDERIAQEVLATQDGIDLVTGGKQPRYLRPPFGEINQHTYDKLASLGFKVVLWTLDLKDWRATRTKQHLMTYYQSVMDKADPTKDSLILILHEKRVTLESLSDIIRVARDKSFRFVSIEECLAV